MTFRYYSSALPDVWQAVHRDVDESEVTDLVLTATWDQLEALIREAVPAQQLAYDVRRRAFKLPSGKVRIEVEIHCTEATP